MHATALESSNLEKKKKRTEEGSRLASKERTTIQNQAGREEKERKWGDEGKRQDFETKKEPNERGEQCNADQKRRQDEKAKRTEPPDHSKQG